MVRLGAEGIHYFEYLPTYIVWSAPFYRANSALTLQGLPPLARRESRGGGRWGGRPPLGRKDPRRRRGFPRLKGRKKGHWCLLNGCSTPFKHNMAINILKSCKFVFAYVKNRSLPSHIRSSFPWRPPLAEILDPRLLAVTGAEAIDPAGPGRSVQLNCDAIPIWR